MKKFIAAVMALCIVGGSLPAVYSGAPECVITASAEEEYTEVTEGSLTYHVYEDHAEVSKCAEDTEGEIIIADKINGVPVTSIEFQAFYECSSLESITIPDSVTRIGAWAFRDCSSFESITIPDSVTYIGEYAFAGCSYLENITLSKSLDSFYGNPFSGTPWLKNRLNEYPFLIINGWLVAVNNELSGDVVIPDDVIYIDKGVFCDCNKIESVVVPKSVGKLGFDCFYKLERLNSITILNPDCLLNNIVEHDFKGTIYGYEDSPAQQYAQNENIKFESIGKSSKTTANGLKYEIVGSEICITEHTDEMPSEVVIPTKVGILNVTSIADEAFMGCENLTSITIPDSVTSIGSWAFSGCTSLTSVMIPDSVIDIAGLAFDGCDNLSSITIMNPDCEIYDDSGTISNGYDNHFVDYYTGTIYGYEGSTAQAYAEKYGYKFESLGEASTDESPTSGTDLKKGDANGDDEVNMSDVVMVMQAALNPKKYGVNGTSEDRITAEGEKAGDVDGKEGLSANDALIIQRFTLNLIDNL